MAMPKISRAASVVYFYQDEYGGNNITSPVFVPSGVTSLTFENLSGLPATVILPAGVVEKGKETVAVPDDEQATVVLLPGNEKGKRCFRYKVKFGKRFLGKGGSAPMIIRER